MDNLTTNENLKKLAEKMAPGGRVTKSWPLSGGVSAQVKAVEITLPDGQVRHLVVRLHGEADRQGNPAVAECEFKLLEALQATPVPAPKPYFLDSCGQIWPQPGIAIEYLQGETVFEAARVPGLVPQLAETLAQIHRVDLTRVDLSFLPHGETRLPEQRQGTETSKDVALGWQALAAAWPLPAENPPALLHGDFWPGNILWHAGELVGVVDWEDARLGDPLQDLANSRLELLWAYDWGAMETFTRHYLALTKAAARLLPYWDLWAALRTVGKISRWGLDARRVQRMRVLLEQFMGKARAC
jgi:aminoglycoside phosphotransferase (APT) family kinase protein